MWYIYTMEYYSTIKKNEIMPSAATWMDLEIVTEWSKSDREGKISYDIPYWRSNKRKYKWTYLQNRNRLTDLENKHIVVRAGEGGRMRRRHN